MMASPDKRILYLSSLHNGKTHDYQILKSEFPCTKNWFEHLSLRLDSGFQGFYKDYKCSDVKLPIKRKRVAKGIKNELTHEEKQYNKELAKERIVVENSIAGLKRFHLITNRLRLKLDFSCLDNIMLVLAGLWNLNVANRLKIS
jgi:hypothetical protein